MAKESETEQTVKGKEHSISQAEFQPTEPLKEGSKDDIGIVSPTPPQPEQVKPSTTSWFSSYVAPVVKLGTQASESRYGKVLLGNAVSRATTTLFSVGLLAELWPPAIPFAVTGAVVSLAAVGVSTVVDTVKTRSLRKLAEESDLLVKNRDALSKQQYILKNLSPELSEILKDQLYIPNPQEQDNNYTLSAEKALNASQVISDSVPAATNFAVQTMMAASGGSILGIVHSIRTGATTAAALIGGATNAQYMVDVSKALKLHINEERPHAGEYSNIEELRANVEKQEIQTLAIQKLLQEKDYFTLTPKEKQERFIALQENLVESVDLTEQLQKYGAQPVAKQSDSILSDLGRAHDPFYVQPTLKPSSELTKAMASEKAAKESAKEIISPKVRNLVSTKSEDGVSQKPLSPQELGQQLSDQRRLVSSEDLGKRKKEAAHLDLAEINADKAKTIQKSRTTKQGIAK